MGGLEGGEGGVIFGVVVVEVSTQHSVNWMVQSR